MSDPTMHLYAVALRDGASPPVTTVEFYWADDRDHACEQAEDADPDPGIPRSIEFVAIVPTQDGGYLSYEYPKGETDERPV